MSLESHSVSHSQWSRLNEIAKEEEDLLKKWKEIGEKLTKLSAEKNTILSLKIVSDISSKSSGNGKLSTETGSRLSSKSSDDLLKKKRKDEKQKFKEQKKAKKLQEIEEKRKDKEEKKERKGG